MTGRRPERTRLDECRSCGATFVSARGTSGRWTRTCSLPCRLAALDRFLAGLAKARDTFAAQVEADRARGPGRR
jgi:hypothetical protein